MIKNILKSNIQLVIFLVSIHLNYYNVSMKSNAKIKGIIIEGAVIDMFKQNTRNNFAEYQTN